MSTTHPYSFSCSGLWVSFISWGWLNITHLGLCHLWIAYMWTFCLRDGNFDCILPLDIEMQCNWREFLKQLVFHISCCMSTLSHTPHIHHHLSNHRNQVWCGWSWGGSQWNYGIWEAPHCPGLRFSLQRALSEVYPEGRAVFLFPGLPWKTTPFITEQTMKVTIGYSVRCHIICHPYMNTSES